MSREGQSDEAIAMKKTISTSEVRRKLGDILDRVDLRHDQFIIERNGKPLAVLVHVEKLDRMERAARLDLIDVLERQKGKASLSRVEAEGLVDEAKHRKRR